jgi:hypothetical protein
MPGLMAESKFTKSKRNAGTEREGLGLLLSDLRFQGVDLPTKRRILELVGASQSFGIQTFDAVMTPTPVPPISADNIDEHYPMLRLIEMKTTRKPIRNRNLNGFFFGATEREYDMARALGDRYLFAFIVLNSTNDYARPFAVLLTLEEVERRTRSQRIQYQVNFRSEYESPAGDGWVIILGDETHIPLTPSEPDALVEGGVPDVDPDAGDLLRP